MNNLAIIDFKQPEDLTEQTERAVVSNWLPKNENTRRAYEKALADLLTITGTELLCQAMPAGNPQQAASVMRRYEASLENLSARTVNLRFSALRKLLVKLEKAGCIAPCSYWLELRKVPRAALSEADLPTVDQVLQLFRTEKDPTRALLWRVLYYIGPRISEALRLTKSDFVVVDEKPCVRLVVKGGNTQYREVVPWLMEMLEQHAAELGPDDPLFPMHPDTATSWANRAWRRVGWKGNEKIKGANHAFRHCHVTHALKDVSLADAGLSAGHMNSSTTRQSYAHYVPRTSGHVLPRG